MRKIIIIVLIILCTLQSKAASNYYFSSVSGDDSRTSTQAKNPATPWKTITKLNSFFSSLVAGDSVLFKRGETFIGVITINKSGTSPSPITIAYYGTGAKPIITSFVNITGFASVGNGVYTAAANSSLLSTCNIILWNGVMQRKGRFPNYNAANSGYLTYQAATQGATTSSLTSTALSSTTLWTGASAYIRGQKFDMNTLPISSQAGSKLNFSDVMAGGFVLNSGFFITNDIRTLDQVGEWFYKTTTKQVSLYNTSLPTGVTAVSLNNLILSSGFSFITVDGLDLRGANADAIFITNGSGWKIKNTDINWSGNEGIRLEGSNNPTIISCTIENSLTDGIYLHNVSGASVTLTSVHNTAQYPGMQGTNGQVGIGIHHTGFNSTFSTNRVINTGYSGISSVHSSTGSDILIMNNVVDTFCNVSNDGGGIYTVNANLVPVTNFNITANIVMNGIGAIDGSTNSFTSAEGIYLDNHTNHVNVTGNTTYRTQRGIYLHWTVSCNVRGNTSFDNVYGFYAQSAAAGKRLRTCTNNANKYVARTAAQYSGYFITDSTNVVGDIKQFFTTCDSNYYCRPINQPATPTHMRNSGANISLPSWQTAYNAGVRTPPYDSHSKVAPFGITSDGQFAFYYNATSSPVDVNITGNYVDMANIDYNGITTLQPFTSLVLINTGMQSVPTITWANPLPSITYGTNLTTSLNATASTAGTFAYNEAGTTITAATVLNAGTHNLTVVFTPTNGAAFTTATKTVTLVVNKATATLTYTVLSRPYTGLPQGVGIVTSPAGLTGVTTLYGGLGQTPTNAGSYAVTSGLTNTNYTASPISSTYVITQISATLSASNLAQTYDGTPKPITVVTNPLGLSGVAVTYNGSGTVPTNAGSYPIVVTLTNQNYTATPINTTLVISKATPTVTWATPAAITYGTALSGTQLNASASVAGTFTYTPASGTIPNAGTQTLSVDFTPTDATNYNSVNNTTVDITVNKATATITLGNLNQFADGNPKTVTVTTSPANLQTIVVTYNGSTTPPSAVGSYPIIATLTNANYTAVPATGNLVISSSAASIFITNLAQTYTGSPLPVTVTTNPVGLSHTTTYNASATVPTNAGSYTVIATINDGIHTGADTQTLVISKAIPVITWSNPADITFGTALSGTELNASANVAGSFVYSPLSGTILNVGNSQVLSTTFTPTDGSNYVSISKTVLINVTTNTATINLSGLLQTYNGNPKSVIVTTTPNGLSGIQVLYNGSATLPTNAGSYTVYVTLTNDNYTATPATGTLVINKLNPVISWIAITPIPVGTPLSNIQLSATANVAGVMTYNPTFGAVLPVGTSNIIATFTPTDNTNYNTVTKTNSISVYGTSNPSQSYYIINGQTIYINLP